MQWVREKQDWCCRNVGRGCPFNCVADFEHRDVRWSLDKQQWCPPVA